MNFGKMLINLLLQMYKHRYSSNNKCSLSSDILLKIPTSHSSSSITMSQAAVSGRHCFAPRPVLHGLDIRNR